LRLNDAPPEGGVKRGLEIARKALIGSAEAARVV
jgi:hypothetical protein